LIAPLLLLSSKNISITALYSFYVFLGFAAGYWILLLTSATERFGTNIRATATTSIPNFIRAAIIPISWVFLGLKGEYGTIQAAILTGIGTSALATISLFLIKESFHDDLDFTED